MKAQEPRPGGLVPMRVGAKRLEKRYVGSSASETLRMPFERGTLRRANPKSAAGVKQSRHGFEGSKPPRG
jgi:hypothetical protein